MSLKFSLTLYVYEICAIVHKRYVIQMGQCLRSNDFTSQVLAQSFFDIHEPPPAWWYTGYSQTVKQVTNAVDKISSSPQFSRYSLSKLLVMYLCAKSTPSHRQFVALSVVHNTCYGRVCFPLEPNWRLCVTLISCAIDSCHCGSYQGFT